MNVDHTSHPINMTWMLDDDTGQDHQKLVHQEKDTGTTLMTGDTGMMGISTNQMVTMVINLHCLKGWKPSYF